MSKKKNYTISTLSGSITQRTFRESTTCPPLETPVVAPLIFGSRGIMGSHIYSKTPYRSYITNGMPTKLDPKIIGSDSVASAGPTQYCDLDHWWKMPSSGEDSPPTEAVDVAVSAVSRINVNTSNIVVSGSSRTLSGSTFDTYYFNGTDSTMYVNNASTLEPYPLTITFWMKPYTLSQWDVLFINNESVSGWSRGMGCYINASDEKIYFWNRNYANSKVGADLPSLNEWTHVACVLQGGGSGQTIYTNGVQGTSITGETPRSVETNRWFVIGSNGYGTGGTPVSTNYWFDGLLSDFRIYSKVLTGAQIASIMNGDYDP